MNYVDLPPGISLFFKTLNVISPPFPGGGVVDGRFEPHITFQGFLPDPPDDSRMAEWREEKGQINGKIEKISHQNRLKP